MFSYTYALSLTFVLTYCSTKEAVAKVEEPRLLKMDDFTQYGEVDNMIPTHAFENFDTRIEVVQLDEGLAHFAEFQKQFVDQMEYENSIVLCDVVETNYRGTLSTPVLQRIVDDIIIEWEAQQYSASSPYGESLATSLAISKSSPEWIGADVIGVIFGAASVAIGQLTVQGEIG